jgi:hypothetical protein
MTNDSEFDLEKEAEGFACLYYYNANGERVSAGSNPIKADCFKAGFSKALDLVMEEALERWQHSIDPRIEGLQAIICKLRGER